MFMRVVVQESREKQGQGRYSASRVGSAAPFPLGLSVLQARIARLPPSIAIRSLAGGTLNTKTVVLDYAWQGRGQQGPRSRRHV